MIVDVRKTNKAFNTRAMAEFLDKELAQVGDSVFIDELIDVFGESIHSDKLRSCLQKASVLIDMAIRTRSKDGGFLVFRVS